MTAGTFSSHLHETFIEPFRNRYRYRYRFETGFKRVQAGGAFCHQYPLPSNLQRTIQDEANLGHVHKRRHFEFERRKTYELSVRNRRSAQPAVPFIVPAYSSFILSTRRFQVWFSAKASAALDMLSFN
jgi:hypothetical protein